MSCEGTVIGAPLAVVALHDDFAVLHRAAHATLLLEPLAQGQTVGRRAHKAPDQGHGLASASCPLHAQAELLAAFRQCLCFLRQTVGVVVVRVGGVDHSYALGALHPFLFACLGRFHACAQRGKRTLPVGHSRFGSVVLQSSSGVTASSALRRVFLLTDVFGECCPFGGSITHSSAHSLDVEADRAEAVVAANHRAVAKGYCDWKDIKVIG